MTTRIAALIAGLLLGTSTANAAPLPKCPLIFLSGGGLADNWLNDRGPCRLGQFTFRDFYFDNDDGLAYAFVDQIQVKLLKDHLSFTFHSAVPRVDYALDAVTHPAGFDWYREQFGANITADDGTRFTRSTISSPMAVLFGVPAGGEAFATVWGGGLGLGCRASGFSVGPCPLTAMGPQGPGTVDGARSFEAGFFALTSVEEGSTAPLTVSLINPTWTTTLWFTSPSVVPEPSTWALFATGLAVVGLITWRRRRAA